jgi:hypothetical protein
LVSIVITIALVRSIVWMVVGRRWWHNGSMRWCKRWIFRLEVSVWPDVPNAYRLVCLFLSYSRETREGGFGEDNIPGYGDFLRYWIVALPAFVAWFKADEDARLRV